MFTNKYRYRISGILIEGYELSPNLGEMFVDVNNSI